LRERECGFDGEADGAEACGVEGVKCWDWGDQEFECEEGNEEVEEELPVSANYIVSKYSQILYRYGRTHGLCDRHCQKLYGLGISNSLSLAPAKGMDASPPFEDGAGRWSRATFNSTN